MVKQLKPTERLSSFKIHEFSGLEPLELADCYRLSPAEAFASLLRGLFIGTSSVVMRRSALEQVGPFDEVLPNGDDRDMWLRFARSGRQFVYRDAVAYDYRVHQTSISRRGPRRLPGVIAVLERQLPFIADPGLCVDVERRIAQTRLAYGHGLRRAGDYGAARAAFLQVLRTRPCWSALRGLALAMLGIRREGN